MPLGWVTPAPISQYSPKVEWKITWNRKPEEAEEHVDENKKDKIRKHEEDEQESN